MGAETVGKEADYTTLPTDFKNPENLQKWILSKPQGISEGYCYFLAARAKFWLDIANTTEEKKEILLGFNRRIASIL